MIIGIKGPAGHGKDTVGVIMRSQATAKCLIYKFASPLKLLVSNLTDLPGEVLEDQTGKSEFLSSEWDYWTIDGDHDNDYGRYSSYKDAAMLAEFVGESPTEDIVHHRQTARDLLRSIGMGLRDIHPRIWVNKLEREVKFNKERNHIIITDVRFLNEVEWIESEGGFIIDVNRGAAADNHRSETELKDYPVKYYLDNSGTLEDLRIKVKDIVLKENL